ncbi:MBL fold metallo-hydrolase [Cohnella hashimotonis]|uniref:MBL fold metallo-hydrolase n=1 Tax=Cohnella hashimotonis TaxID=2826895 RepID=A0ABT6TB41_9BACL|nr:MBL fold metallo-hydrolase [Cohnella hashimotonis]MDI4644040.1 MBL fold metallo-hydrolase [Cohnella hashimotonis]
MHRLYPVMIQVDEGIYLVGSGKYGFRLSDPMDCNVYLLDGGNGKYAMVDAGGGMEPERIAANIERLGVSPTQIQVLLLTHGHGDHAAGAAYFQRQYGMQVMASEEIMPWIQSGDREKTSIDAAVRAGVYPADYEFPPCPVARGLRESDEIAIGDLVLKAIDTPGHARGHLSFLLERDGRKLLFGGDSVFAGGKVVIQNVWDCVISEYAATVEKLHGLRIDSLFPGHGVVLLTEAWRAVAEAHACFERLDVPPNL